MEEDEGGRVVDESSAFSSAELDGEEDDEAGMEDDSEVRNEEDDMTDEEAAVEGEEDKEDEEDVEERERDREEIGAAEEPARMEEEVDDARWESEERAVGVSVSSMI